MAAVIHQDFLINCLENDLQPKGVRIKLPCMALAAKETNIIQQFDNILQATQKQLLHTLLLYHKVIEEKYEPSSNGLVKMINEEVQTYSDEQKSLHERTMKATNANLNKRVKNKLAAGNNKLLNLYLEKTGHRLQQLASFEDSDSPGVDALIPTLNMRDKKVSTTMVGNPGGVGPPPVPRSQLSTLEWPIAQAPSGDSCTDQPNKDKGKGKGKGKERVNISSSSLNYGHLQTRTSTDQASHSSSPSTVPYHSPTLDSGR